MAELWRSVGEQAAVVQKSADNDVLTAFYAL